jgi:CheY-specific phosphatase CheX
LSGNWGIKPLCVRANNTKLSKNDVAVLQGGAGNVRGSIGLSVMVAVAIFMFAL